MGETAERRALLRQMTRLTGQIERCKLVAVASGVGPMRPRVKESLADLSRDSDAVVDNTLLARVLTPFTCPPTVRRK